MNILSVSKLRKEFYGNLLFDYVSFDIDSNDKVALVGKNGIGKTTLLKMIVGIEQIDSGQIHHNKQVSIGYLSQNVIGDSNNTLWEEMITEFSSLVKLEELMNKVSLELSFQTHNQKLLDRYSRLQSTYERSGGYEYLTEIKSILHKFGFDEDMFNRKIETFSGGEKTKAAFAKLLLRKPNLLILDEPTNHLDLHIIDWLEEHLVRYDGAILLVTHDKTFISRVANKIFEIDYQRLHVYHGNFEMYQDEKIKRLETLIKQQQKQKKEIMHLQSFVSRFRFNAKRASIAQDRLKKISKIKVVDVPKSKNKQIRLSFSEKRPTKEVVISAKNLNIGYDKTIVKDISFVMRGTDKVGIIGRNGSGKTTLLKTLLGSEKPISGKIEFVKSMKFGYFDQSQTKLHPNKTIFSEIHDANPMMTNYEIRSVAAKFLFIGDDLEKQISVLSGGEKVRLVLLLIMLEKPNILILDEPTNHLDMETREVVEDVLDQFVGPILFVSHDRSLINRIATKLLVIDNNLVTEFLGNYDEYKTQIINNIIGKENTKKRKSRVKNISPIKKISKTEMEIEKLTKLIESLHKQTFLPEIYVDNKKINKILTEIEINKKLLADLEKEYLFLLEELEREEQL